MWKSTVAIAVVVWTLPFPWAALGQNPQTLPVQAQAGESGVVAPPYNPPQILVATAIDSEDNLLLVSYRTIYIGFTGESYNSRTVTKAALKDVAIVNVKGETISLDAARRRIGDRDTPVLCSSWGTPLPDFYASIFAVETLHFIFPEKSPVWKEIQEPGRPLK